MGQLAPLRAAKFLGKFRLGTEMAEFTDIAGCLGVLYRSNDWWPVTYNRPSTRYILRNTRHFATCCDSRLQACPVCGARMIVDDAITDGDKIAEVLARLGIISTGPPKRRQSTGELDYVYDV
jgi:hypothetical protein